MVWWHVDTLWHFCQCNEKNIKFQQIVLTRNFLLLCRTLKNQHVCFHHKLNSKILLRYFKTRIYISPRVGPVHSIKKKYLNNDDNKTKTQQLKVRLLSAAFNSHISRTFFWPHCDPQCLAPEPIISPPKYNPFVWIFS